MSAGRLKYFTSAYINIRVLRETAMCTLPIEVFYVGDIELPRAAVDHMHASFKDVTFIDITRVKGLPAGLELNGYQIKPFAMLLSSFAEILWMDADAYALTDPAMLFDTKPYRDTGALFWSDTCNFYSNRLETYHVFGLPNPPGWSIELPVGIRRNWPRECSPQQPLEFETGQIVLNKHKAWRGLVLTVFVNKNYHYFLENLFWGEKQTFPFAFNASSTAYALNPKPFFGVGLAAVLENGEQFMCANTLGQRHPETGHIVFLHRHGVKFRWAGDFLKYDPVPRAWTHLAAQSARSPWHGYARNEAHVPREALMPDDTLQRECFVPGGGDANIRPVDPSVCSVTAESFDRDNR